MCSGGAPARANADVPPNPARTRGHGRQRSSKRESVTGLLEQEATASVRLTCGCSVEQGEARPFSSLRMVWLNWATWRRAATR